MLPLTANTQSLAPAPLPPSPENYDYDIAIAGGGIVGLTLAAALHGSGLRIAVVEPQTQSEAAAKGQAYALHLISSRIFAGIGVWSAMVPYLEPFRQVRMSDGDCPHVVTFEPADLQTPTDWPDVLGHVAEHGVLLRALQAFLHHCPDVTWLCPARVEQTEFDQTGVNLHLGGMVGADFPTQIRVKLLVAADGFKSPIREQRGIATHGWPYWQSCIVVTVATEKPHNSTAYERFWPSGPFAILPLPGNHCRIVWTAPHAEAQAMLALDPERFLHELSRRFGDQMGQLTLTSQPFLFPAKLMHARHYIQSRLALVGDAAHCCHPVGGQGLNLGVRDAAALAEVIKTAHERGQDIGQLSVLRQYQSWRRGENWLTLAMTDLLDRVFSNQWWVLVRSRRLGLWLMQRLLPLKRWSLRFMAGLVGCNPSLAQSSPVKPTRETVSV